MSSELGSKMKLTIGIDKNELRELDNLMFSESAQQCVHPTGGSLRVFRQFALFEVDSDKIVLSRPTHQRVTRTVGLIVLV